MKKIFIWFPVLLLPFALFIGTKDAHAYEVDLDNTIQYSAKWGGSYDGAFEIGYAGFTFHDALPLISNYYLTYSSEAMFYVLSNVNRIQVRFSQGGNNIGGGYLYVQPHTPLQLIDFYIETTNTPIDITSSALDIFVAFYFDNLTPIQIQDIYNYVFSQTLYITDNLSNIYSYNDSVSTFYFNQGYNQGYQNGYDNAYNFGFNTAKQEFGVWYQGVWYNATAWGTMQYNHGVNEGANVDFSVLSLIMDAATFTDRMLSIEIGAGFTIGSLFLIPIVWGALMLIIKFTKG